MTLIVTRESLTTETQHTSPSFIANSGNQVLVGVDDPLPQINVNGIAHAAEVIVEWSE